MSTNLGMWHVEVAQFLDLCRTRGFLETDIFELRQQLEAMDDRAAQRRAPEPATSKATTLAETPKSLDEARSEYRRTGSSQKLRAIVLKDPDEDDE